MPAPGRSVGRPRLVHRASAARQAVSNRRARASMVLSKVTRPSAVRAIILRVIRTAVERDPPGGRGSSPAATPASSRGASAGRRACRNRSAGQLAGRPRARAAASPRPIRPAPLATAGAAVRAHAAAIHASRSASRVHGVLPVFRGRAPRPPAARRQAASGPARSGGAATAVRNAASRLVLGRARGVRSRPRHRRAGPRRRDAALP